MKEQEIIVSITIDGNKMEDREEGYNVEEMLVVALLSPLFLVWSEYSRFYWEGSTFSFDVLLVPEV